MKKRWRSVLLVVATAVMVGAATASAGGGNSANAKLCQGGGWQTLLRADGSSFSDQGDCVSYGAQGGTLTGKTKAQLDCEAFGATFSTDPASDLVHAPTFDPFAWSCNGVPFSDAENEALALDCAADSGALVGEVPPNFSCYF